MSAQFYSELNKAIRDAYRMQFLSGDISEDEAFLISIVEAASVAGNQLARETLIKLIPYKEGDTEYLYFRNLIITYGQEAVEKGIIKSIDELRELSKNGPVFFDKPDTPDKKTLLER